MEWRKEIGEKRKQTGKSRKGIGQERIEERGNMKGEGEKRE